MIDKGDEISTFHEKQQAIFRTMRCSNHVTRFKSRVIVNPQRTFCSLSKPRSQGHPGPLPGESLGTKVHYQYPLLLTPVPYDLGGRPGIGLSGTEFSASSKGSLAFSLLFLSTFSKDTNLERPVSGLLWDLKSS